MANTQDRYKAWLNSPYLDSQSKAELESIGQDQIEIEDRFYQELQFGTAGLRGILGAGSNRMNFYTVARAADGFARFFVDQGPEYCQRGLAISYDSRRFSPEFAALTAQIFAGHGVKVYLADELRPVPMLSYAIRHYKCAGGVMITASHNPKQYNGFKAYGEDGGQLPPEAANLVSAAMDANKDYLNLLEGLKPLEYWQDQGRVVMLGEDLDQSFNAMLQDLAVNKAAIKKQKDLKIVYTPIHGSGNKPVRRILASLGFDNILVVKEQELPDPDFPTAPYPNPEIRQALQLGIDLAEREQADLLIATDPDADRTGVAVRSSTGEFIVLSGNQIGILLMDYILAAKQAQGQLPDKSFCATTIVSSKLTRKIASHYGVDLTEVLTGFKYIGEQIKLRDEEGDEHFQFGFEESFGYLAGTQVRDKDAVVASMLVAEMAAVEAQKGKTLYDRLLDLYDRFGYAAEKTLAIRREGKVGQEQIGRVLTSLRSSQGHTFDSLGVRKVKDYQTQQVLDLETGKTDTLSLPQSNVLLYQLDGLDWFCARPSGTEPLLKVYMGAYAEKRAEAESKLKAIEECVQTTIEGLLAD